MTPTDDLERPAPRTRSNPDLHLHLEALATCACGCWADKRPEAYRALERLCTLQVAAYARRRGLRQRDLLVDLSVRVELALRHELPPEGRRPTPTDLLEASDLISNRLTQRERRDSKRFARQHQAFESSTARPLFERESASESMHDEPGQLSADARLIVWWVECAAWTAARNPSARLLPAYILNVAEPGMRPGSRMLRHLRAALDAILARESRSHRVRRAALARALQEHLAPRGPGRRELVKLLDNCRVVLRETAAECLA